MERLAVLLRRFTIKCTADRKRFALLCILMSIGLLFWARIIVIKNLPRAVMADGEQEIAALGAETAPGSEADNNGLPVRTIALDLDPGRDPFRINPAYFPRSEEPALLPRDEPKSGPSSSEDPEQAINHLRLEAVMQGNPMAVISGRTYRPGEEIETGGSSRVRFTLVEVRRRSVLLEHAGRQYELGLDGSR